MSIAAQAIGEAPVSAQPAPVSGTTVTKPVKRRMTVAKADAALAPEAR